MIRRIAALLAREFDRENRTEPVKYRVHDYVRATKPPHGRGKHVVQAVYDECWRQLTTRRRRRQPREFFWSPESYRRRLSTRYNLAYAGTFKVKPYYNDRFVFAPQQISPNLAHLAFSKGDVGKEECFAIKLWRRTPTSRFVIALVCRRHTFYSLMVRHPCGKIVRTRLHSNSVSPKDMGEALICVANTVVRRAISDGLRVIPDYERRLFYIHHGDGSISEKPWVVSVATDVVNQQMGGLTQRVDLAGWADGDEDRFDPEEAHEDGIIVVSSRGYDDDED